MIEEMAKRVFCGAGLPPALRYRRALHLQLRQRGAEAHLAAAHGQGRGDHRHRHDRARHGQRPAGRAHHGAHARATSWSSTARRPSSPTAGWPISSSSSAKTDTSAGAKGVSLVLVEADRAGLQARAQPQEDRPERAGHGGAVLRGRARAAVQHPGRGGPRLRLPDEPAAARAPAGQPSARWR